jgi:hypothetical protein
MSKTSRRNKAINSLESKLGNYNKYGGQSPYSGYKYTKPGSKQIK